MKTNSKTLRITALVIFGAICAFAGGTFFGVKLAYKIYKPSFSAEIYVKTRLAQVALEKIDKNNIQDGHNLILLQVNNGILTLDSLLEDEDDKEMKRKIERLLGHIGMHRTQYPKYYDVNETFLPKTSEKMPQINEILDKYKSKS